MQQRPISTESTRPHRGSGPLTRTVVLALTLAPGLALGLGAEASAQEVVEIPRADWTATLTAEEVFRIGGIDGADWAQFGRIETLAFDGAGRLYVHDLQNNRIAVVGPGGSYVRDVAEQGGGPGEFGAPMAMATDADGGVTVFDAGHMAFLRFGSAGEYVDQEPHSFENGIPRPGAVFADPEGGILYSASGSVQIRRGPGGSTSLQQDEGRPIRRAGSGSRDGIAYRAWQLPSEASMETMSGGGIQFTAAMPRLRAFEPQLFFGVLSNGEIVVADTTDYAIKVVSPVGDVRRVLRRPFEPREVGRRERNAEKERRLEELENQSGGGMRMIVRGGGGGGGSQGIGADAVREMMTGRIETMEFADQIPVISDLRVDPWGDRIWVQRAGERIGREGPTDVLSTEGAYLGTLEGADAEIPMAFGPNGLVAYLETDELDVPTIVVRRITLSR